MSPLGNIAYADSHGQGMKFSLSATISLSEYFGKPYSEETAVKVDAEVRTCYSHPHSHCQVKKLVDSMFTKTKKLIFEKRSRTTSVL